MPDYGTHDRIDPADFRHPADLGRVEKARTEPTWPIEKLPFEWEYIKGFPEPVTIQLLVHRLNCCAEAILEIGEQLDEWWEAQVEEGQYPLDDSGYRSLPGFYEQWLMNSAYANDCTRLVAAYYEAVKVQQSDGSESDRNG